MTTNPVRKLIPRSRILRFSLEPETKATILGGLTQALIGTAIWAADRYAECPVPGALNPPALCFSPSLRDIALLGGLAGGILAGYLADLSSTVHGVFVGVASALAGGFLGAFSVAMIVGLGEVLPAELAVGVQGLWVLVAGYYFIIEVLPMIRIGILTSPFGGLLGAYLRSIRRRKEAALVQTEVALEQKQSGP